MSIHQALSDLLKERTEFQDTINVFDEQIKRLQETKKKHQEGQANVDAEISELLMKADGQKAKVDDFALSFRRSKQTIITDEAAIDERFKKVIFQVDKNAVKDAIERGESVTGAEVVEVLNLQIKAA